MTSLQRILAAIALVTAAGSARAQVGASPTSSEAPWAALRAAPNVDTARVTWLSRHMTPADARTLFGMIDRLSKPEVGQLLVERMYGDGSVALDAALADSLYKRPRPGTAGVADVAYFVMRLRESVLTRARAGGTFATTFTGERLVVPKASRPPAASTQRWRLRFDVAPAETLFAIVSTPDISIEAATKRISTSAFDQLIQHHSQPFYPVPWSRELMGANLARAASTNPIDRLYVFAQPRGLLQYGDVSANRDQYRAILRSLAENEKAILTYVSDTLGWFVPDGFTIDRSISIYFAGGADGWGTSTTTAFDLEYFKDNYARLLNVILHETYHAAQTAVGRTSSPALRLVTPGDSALNLAATTLLLEGTANFIAAGKALSADSVMKLAREGERLVTRVYEATRGRVDRDAARQALNTGVASAGPFYWLGALMSKTIVDAFGPKALAATLKGSGPDFVAEYVRAAKASPDAPKFLAPEIIAAILKLRG